MLEGDLDGESVGKPEGFKVLYWIKSKQKLHANGQAFFTMLLIFHLSHHVSLLF